MLWEKRNNKQKCNLTGILRERLKSRGSETDVTIENRLKRFDKDISEKVEVKETDNENSDQEEDQLEQESVARKERPTILESFKDKLTEFLDNAE